MVLQPFSHVILDFDGVVADTESVFDSFDAALMQSTLRTLNSDIVILPSQMRLLAGNNAEKNSRK